jgi:hypothetical protein
MAEFKLGRLRFVWQGTWQTSFNYVKDDIVAYGGNTYVCLVGNTSSSTQLGFNTDLASYWSLMQTGISWKAAWVQNTNYKVNDIVRVGSKMYICIVGHNSTNVANTGFYTDLTSSYWALLSNGIGWIGTWTTSTFYNIGDIVKFGAKDYICLVQNTSSATPNSGFYTDLASNYWALLVDGVTWQATWTASTFYKIGDIVKYGGIVYICNTGHTSSTTLEANQSNWTTFATGFNWLGTWTNATTYKVNDVVSYGADAYICNTAHTSAGGQLNGSYFSIFVQGLEFQNSYNAGTNYYLGDVVTYGGYVYTSLQTPNVGNTPSTASAYWQILTTGYSNQGVWSSATAYKVGNVVSYGAYTYVAILDGTNQNPASATTYWSLLNTGISWQNAWANAVNYRLGDAVSYASSSYICILAHLSNSGTNRPDIDSGVHWSILAQGSATATLTTQGDTLYYSGGGLTRLPVGTDGQSMKVTTTSTGTLQPVWSNYGFLNNVYYVAPTGFNNGGLTPNTTFTITAGTSVTGAATYTNVPVLSTTGVGVGAQFTIVKTGAGTTYNGVTTITVTNPGYGYAIGDSIVINGLYLGGAVTTNNLTFTVATAVANGYGYSIDKPWQTIAYACLQAKNGPANPNAQFLITANRAFMVAEINNYVTYTYKAAVTGVNDTQLATASTAGLYVGMPIRFSSLAGISTTVTQTYASQTLTVSSSSGTGITMSATITGTVINQPVIFSTSFGSIVGGTVYYVQNVAGAVLTVSISPGSSAFTAGSGGTGTATLQGTLVLASTTNLTYNVPLTLSGSSFGNLSIGSTYYVANVISSTLVTFSASSGGAVITGVTAGSGTITLVTNNTFTLNSVAISTSTTYYVQSILPNTSFAVSATSGGTALPAAGTGTATASLYYSSTQTNSDTGNIIDGVYTDLGRGGNAITVTNALAFFSGQTTYSTTFVTTSVAQTVPAIIAGQVYLQYLIGRILANLTPTNNYQTLNGVGSPVTQTINGSYVAESGSTTTVQNLIGIISTALTDQTTTAIPLPTQPNITINVKSGVYNEVLPITIPSFTSIIGDELRAVTVQPYTFSVQATANTLNTITVLNTANIANGMGITGNQYIPNGTTITSFVASTGVLTLSNNLTNPITTATTTTFSAAVGSFAITATSGTSITCASTTLVVGQALTFNSIIGAIVPNQTYYVQSIGGTPATNFTISTVAIGGSALTIGTTVGLSGVTATASALNLITVGSTTGMTIGTPLQFTGTTFGSLSVTTYYIINNAYFSTNQIVVSTTLGGSTITVSAGSGTMSVVVNPILGSTGVLTVGYNASNMFYMRDGSAARNFSVKGLSSALGTANGFGTQRPLGGSFFSLDPGAGSTDDTVWIKSRSPYVQNVSTFGTASTGMKIDGALHGGGNRSMVANDFTNVISDGIAIWCTNVGVMEAVSVFSYYGYAGYLSDAGGKIRATNGNSSYGTYGVVAEGSSSSETPITGTVNTQSQGATAPYVLMGGGQILWIEYANAGQSYSTSSYGITSGSGAGAVVASSNYFTQAVPEIRVITGGAGYITASNVAQYGTTTTIQLSASDTAATNGYNGMRIVITAGTGAGQYGYVNYYNSSTKTAIMLIDSFVPFNTTTCSTTVFTVTSTATLSANLPIVFTGTPFGGVANNTVYYVSATNFTATQFSISLTSGGAVFTLTSGSGAMNIAAAGWNTALGGAAVATLDGSTRYIVEPRVTFTGVGSGLLARAVVTSNQISAIRIINCGTGYSSAPSIIITDPNSTTSATFTVRTAATGVLGQPTWTSRGTNYTDASITITGNGFADYQAVGFYMYVNLTAASPSAFPVAGANIVFTGNSNYYSLVQIVGYTGSSGNYVAQIQINPATTVTNAPVNGTTATFTIQYSQARLTGHDFLYVGSGNFYNTGYATPNFSTANKIPANQTLNSGAGRVFFTSTDQDGNFNVGNLFNVAQSTGIATLSASLFNLSGLNQLQFASGGAVITQFSTDGTMTANSNNIVPTQQAIRAYIASQLGAGGGTINANILNAGQVNISGTTITTNNSNNLLITSTGGTVTLGASSSVITSVARGQSTFTPLVSSDLTNKSYVDAVKSFAFFVGAH